MTPTPDDTSYPSILQWSLARFIPDVEPVPSFPAEEEPRPCRACGEPMQRGSGDLWHCYDCGEVRLEARLPMPGKEAKPLDTP